MVLYLPLKTFHLCAALAKLVVPCRRPFQLGTIGMSDDELSGERKHKEHKKHKSSKRHKHSRHDRDRRDHGARETAPQSTTGPCWQTMQFKLIDGVNRYNAERQEIDGSCIVQGQVADFDMSSFSGLVGYVRETFDIDPGLRLAFSSQVRAPASALASSVRALLALEHSH